MDALLSVRERLLAARPSGFDSACTTSLARVAGQLYVTGQRELADEMIAEANEVDRRETARYPIVFARVEQALGARALHSSDQGTYYEHTKASRALFEAAGDRRNACVAAVNLGYIALTVGAYEEAEEVLVPAVRRSPRSWGSPAFAPSSCRTSASCATSRDETPIPSPSSGRPSTIFTSQGDRRLGAFSHYYLSMALDAVGHTDEALESVQKAVLVSEPLPPAHASTLAGLADLELRYGLPKEQALAHAEEAFQILERLRGLEDNESRVRLVYAEALLAVDRREDAKVAVRTSCEGLVERASKITNPRWRESFLERIPEHAATFALARTLGVGGPPGGLAGT